MRYFKLKDFKKLPVSWGASHLELSNKIDFIAKLDSRIERSRDLLELKRNHYQVTGNDPFLVFNLASFEIDGLDAGVLSFKFSCFSQSNNKPKLAIYWSDSLTGINEMNVVRFNAHNGHLLVPLDTLPRWILAKKLSQLRIDLENSGVCKSFEISEITVNQRKLHD